MPWVAPIGRSVHCDAFSKGGQYALLFLSAIGAKFRIRLVIASHEFEVLLVAHCGIGRMTWRNWWGGIGASRSSGVTAWLAA